MPAQEIWDKALGQLQLELSRSTYDTWLRDTRLVRFKVDVFEVAANNEHARQWLEDRLTSTIARVLTGIAGLGRKVKFVVG